MFEHSSIEQLAGGIVNFLPPAIQCPVKCEEETSGRSGNVKIITRITGSLSCANR
jgi:hypothetical protein